MKQTFIDTVDFDEVSRAASADIVKELCTRLNDGDPDTIALAILFASIDRIQVEAVVKTYESAMRSVDAASQSVLKARAAETLAHTHMVELDYVSLSGDVPNYVRHLMKSWCDPDPGSSRLGISSSGPQSSSSSSGGLSIKSTGL